MKAFTIGGVSFWPEMWKPRRRLRHEPYYVARECAAYAKYYLTVR